SSRGGPSTVTPCGGVPRKESRAGSTARPSTRSTADSPVRSPSRRTSIATSAPSSTSTTGRGGRSAGMSETPSATACAGSRPGPRRADRAAPPARLRLDRLELQPDRDGELSRSLAGRRHELLELRLPAARVLRPCAAGGVLDPLPQREQEGHGVLALLAHGAG